MSRLPVPNTSSPFVDKLGKILNPWNIWLQGFSEAAPTAVVITGASFTPNKIGTVFVTSGGTAISLMRGSVTIVLNNQKIIPISIGDTINFGAAYTAQFLEN